MPHDIGEIARELREALQQQQAITVRLLALCASLEAEAIEKGASGVSVPYDEIVKEWNARCASVGMKKRNTAGETKPAILRVWRKYPSMETWRAALDACARNEWWRGERGWQGTLESFLRPINYGKFFDEGLGAAEPAPSQRANIGGPPVVDKVEEEIAALLDDKSRPLPFGIVVPDPRDVRGKDDQEFVRRRDRLKEALSEDWRFA